MLYLQILYLSNIVTWYFVFRRPAIRICQETDHRAGVLSLGCHQSWKYRRANDLTNAKTSSTSTYIQLNSLGFISRRGLNFSLPCGCAQPPVQCLCISPVVKDSKRELTSQTT
jgi:hypothetical protein